MNFNQKLGESAMRSAGLEPNLLAQYADKPNEFFSEIQNKVIAQYILVTLQWQNPYTKHFKRQALEVGDGVEVLMTNPFQPVDYDESKFVPEIGIKKQDIKTQIIYTTDKKVFEYYLSRPILTAAFSSLERLGAFIAEYTRQLQQSVEIWLWDKISKELGKITNTITLPKDVSLQDAYLKLLITSNQMMNPSKDFNIDGSKWKLNATPKGRQLLITSPETEANWRLNVLASLYNIATLTPNENFAEVIVTTNLTKNDYCYLVDTDAYYIDFRIEQTEVQSFSRNMTIYTAFHLWVRSDLLKNANGVKFQIATK